MYSNMTLKFLIWNNMPCMDFFFLCRIQNQFFYRLLECEIFGHHRLQNNLSQFHTNDISFIRLKGSLTYQMATLFSKEHVISGSSPDNLVCG